MVDRDSVHSIINPERYISESDFILFSPHKHFAIPNGSILKINSTNFSDNIKNNLNFTIRKIKYQKEFLNINQWNFNIIWVLKRIIQKFGYRTKSKFINKDHNKSYAQKQLISKISNLMINLIKAEYKDTKSIKLKRKKNIDLWVKCFSPYRHSFVIDNKSTNFYMLPVKVISDEGFKVIDHFIKIGFQYLNGQICLKSYR